MSKSNVQLSVQKALVMPGGMCLLNGIHLLFCQVRLRGICCWVGWNLVDTHIVLPFVLSLAVMTLQLPEEVLSQTEEEEKMCLG